MALKEANAEVVVTFLKEHVICRFGLPKRIISDNGTPFVNRRVSELLQYYKISHGKSTPYHPQSNGQAEATNKSILRILTKMVSDAPQDWSEHLPLALWAYRTTKHGTTKATPFSLVYGDEAVLPAEIAVPSARMTLEMGNKPERAEVAELLDERRDVARSVVQVYQRRLSTSYEKLVRPRMFEEGEMVLKATDAVM